ncbi:hypothetical protein [Kineobactrum salinum]|uniref:hypothetical protein n=1 Tax=Kineobactrum salinum TaxID=2708301 RepID=UPI0018D84795|nr:hypothetical protein [Kineobactrum salinum]
MAAKQVPNATKLCYFGGKFSAERQSVMAKKPFASSADLGEKVETLEVLAEGYMPSPPREIPISAR